VTEKDPIEKMYNLKQTFCNPLERKTNKSTCQRRYETYLTSMWPCIVLNFL